MIKLGRTNYWFTGDRFVVGNPASSPHRDLTDEDREPLLRYLCTCAFGLNRWQGEENEYGERFSVGEHSLLVAALAGRIATLRGLDASDVALAVRLGAVHDLGETLGLGDIAAPWIRSAGLGWLYLREQCMLHQAHVEALAGISTTPLGASRLVKDADHLAAALERRDFFGDLTGDMEHPDVPRLVAEVFGDEARNCRHFVEDMSEFTLYDVVVGNVVIDVIDVIATLAGAGS